MRAILHETMTGEYVTELDIEAASWSTGVCERDTVSVTVPGYTGRQMLPLMIPRKYTLSLSDDDRQVAGAGVVTFPEANDGDNGLQTVVFPGAGIESVFDRVPILPANYWPLIDVAGYPVAARDTRIVDVDYGTMMKRLYQRALEHPGLALPVEFMPDRSGTREKGWTAVDGKSVQSAVEDIADLLGGVEWDWVPVLDDNDRLTWSLVTATDAQQEITSAFWHTWQTGGTEPDVRKLGVRVSPENMHSTAIFTGGKDDDRVMVARAQTVEQLNQGIPASFLWDSSHSTVSDQATLDGWARAAAADGAAPIQYWSFEVRKERAAGLRKGDWCTLEAFEHWLVPDGSYPRRVLSVSGSVDSDWLQVVVAGEVTW